MVVAPNINFTWYMISNSPKSLFTVEVHNLSIIISLYIKPNAKLAEAIQAMVSIAYNNLVLLPKYV